LRAKINHLAGGIRLGPHLRLGFKFPLLSTRLRIKAIQPVVCGWNVYAIAIIRGRTKNWRFCLELPEKPQIVPLRAAIGIEIVPAVATIAWPAASST
jgi:hypothetical protein